jgi:hypothetical protein
MKKTPRRLYLSRQTLSHLSLAQVSGGAPDTNLTCARKCETIYCPTNFISCPENCTVTRDSCWVSCADGCTVSWV